MMTLFDGLFEKTNNSYNIKTGLSLINNNVLAELSEVGLSESGLSESVNFNKLAWALLNKSKIERLYRNDARNAVPLDKYMNSHWELKGDAFIDITDFKVKYNQTTGLNGRLQANASIGLQGMVREIRHLIAYDNYVDVDISNAHPIFTEWLCDNLGVECHELKEYINDRENIIQEIINYSILNGGKSIDRSFVKTYILKISYGCGDDSVGVIKEKHRHPFINKFVKCIRQVGFKICSLMPAFHSINVERRKKAGKDYNMIGSTMSHLNQYIENQILMKMYSFLPDNEFKLNSALCFDGIMVHKKCFTVDFNKDNFISKCENWFHEMGMSKFKLEVKNMDYHDIVLEKMKEASVEYNWGTNYISKYLSYDYERKLSLLKKHKKSFKDIGFYDELNEEQNEILKEHIGSDHTCYRNFDESLYKNKIWGSLDEVKAHTSAFCNRFIGKYYGSAKDTFIMKIGVDSYIEGLLSSKFIRYWITNRDNQTLEITGASIKSIEVSKFISLYIINNVYHYNKLVFHPYTKFQKSEVEENCFNVFNGFKAKLLDKDDIDDSLVKPWIDHILNVFVGGNYEHFKYFMLYFQTIFKYPRTKTRKVMGFVSSGQQVGGKGAFFIDFVSNLILGKGASGVENGLGFFSNQFNGQLEKRILTIAEECNSINESYHDTFERLKSSVTAASIDINVKYRGLRTVDDFNNYIVLSNNPYCVKVEEQDDRFVLFKTVDIGSDVKKEYFTNLYKYVNQNVANHFYSYVCYMDLESVSLRNSPKTNFYEETKFRSLSSTSKFAAEVLEILFAVDGAEEVDDDEEEEISNTVDFSIEEWKVMINDKKKYFQKKNIYQFKSFELFEIYVEWCKCYNIKKVAEKNGSFKTDISKYFKEVRSNGCVRLNTI